MSPLPSGRHNERVMFAVPEQVLRRAIEALSEFPATTTEGSEEAEDKLQELRDVEAVLRSNLRALRTRYDHTFTSTPAGPRGSSTCPECGASVPLVAHQWLQVHRPGTAEYVESRRGHLRCPGSLRQVGGFAGHYAGGPAGRSVGRLTMAVALHNPSSGLAKEARPVGILCRRLPPRWASVGEASRLVGQLLTAAGREDLLADAQRLVGEMIAEAVLCAETAVDLCCAVVGDRLRLVVGDDRPSRRAGGQSAFARKTPSLLGSTAEACGVVPGPVGWTVWVELAAPRGRRGRGHRGRIPAPRTSGEDRPSA